MPLDPGCLICIERQARWEAETANRAKDDFLAMLSHELRNPLTTILGWVRTLRSGQFPPHRLERGLASIERNAQLHARLMEDLLDIARIASGKLTFEMQSVDLPPIVDAVLETIRGAAADAGVQLIVDIEPEIPRLVADSARLQQVVWPDPLRELV
jgi:signal transduction histidine kinase